MPVTITPPDEEFAAASGSNVNWDPNWSYFDHPPNSTANLTITSNVGDSNPFLFETGETYDITWTGHGGGTMEDAVIVRSDYLGADQGVIVFEGINSNNGELFQMVWTPGFDLEAWYWANGGSPSNPNAFYTSDQDPQNFQFVCYAAGTLIDTEEGPRRVEALRVGDAVPVLDNGMAQIVFVRRNRQHLDGLGSEERPVLIGAGAFAPGLPVSDLVVSPQHRILVGGRGVLANHFDQEVLVPAKALTGLPKIRFMQGRRSVEWVHFAFARHEIVRANGLLAESLLLGSVSLAALDPDEREALTRAFGRHLRHPGPLNGPAARPCLSQRAARMVLSAGRRQQRRRPHAGVAQEPV